MLDSICDITKALYDPTKPFNMQILCSAKKGEAGVYNLNRQIQSIVNSNEEKVQYDFFSYRIGDKIMMIKNNYDAGYVNGDIGIITEIEDKTFTVDLLGVGELTLSKSLLCDMTLAYASTIHKSQGSEYDTVIVSLPKDPSNMLKRNLLHTAITRAKNRIVIITQNGAIDVAVKRCDNINRNTSVLDKLTSEENIIF
jgi:exodeoxyribonuclease V alpha subunit